MEESSLDNECGFKVRTFAAAAAVACGAEATAASAATLAVTSSSPAMPFFDMTGARMTSPFDSWICSNDSVAVPIGSSPAEAAHDG
jgi:hypothetical protein